MTIAMPACGRRILFMTGILAIALFLCDGMEMRQQARAGESGVQAISFDHQVRPILSENCFACHGPDKNQRKARLRLDTKEGAFAPLRSGGFAIAPGKSAASELVSRIIATDPRQRMPPPKKGKHLTAEQIAVLRQWIDQGAKWSQHWAFVKPERQPLPKVKNAGWVNNGIDAFILARLEQAGLEPSAPADKTTILRRVTLDLTGLPPTPAEVEAFLADRSSGAYEKVVNRLLESPRYGEHVGRFWLDAARYGDTHGLHLDNYREIWPYRDWVIAAFNRNQRFDQFIIEQLAGDLLPKPTLDQLVASGFNRCNVTTSEGGSIEEEVYVRNVIDRVDTTGTVFLGLTVGCARCHDHKFDPVKQKDFYQFFAFFNNLDGPALDGNASLPPPIARVPTPEQKTAIAKLDERLAGIRQTISAQAARVPYDENADSKQPEQLPATEYVWFDDDIPTGAKSSSDGGPNGQWKFVSSPNHPVFSGKKSVLREAAGLSQQFFVDAPQKLHIGLGDKLFAYVYLSPARPPREIMLQWRTDDWKHRAYWGANVIDWGAIGTTQRLPMGALPPVGKWVRLEVEAARVGLQPGMTVNGWAFTQHGGTVYWDRAGIVTKTPQTSRPFDTLSSWLQVEQAQGGSGLPPTLQSILKIDRSKRNDAQKKQLREYFIQHAYAKTRSTFTPLFHQLDELQKERDHLETQVPSTLVFKERNDVKPAYILKRGEYDQHGPQVGRATPAFLPPLPEKAPLNRLGLAQWLVSPNHPLTARVAVNRFWQQFFGTGLVKTAEDFGSQGEPPTHPKLLDWLAVQFREEGWDIKKTMKTIVMSATYRQSSRATLDRLARDPDNRLLSRGPRFRLDAEMLRDQALYVSGLLVEKVGGPSVKPPQPEGLWEAVGYTASNTAKFVPDHGPAKVHRRSLYTFWKRTSPPPEMNTFDAPSRESCTVRRERTNTPLQALLLLNDPQYVEAARALAERAMHQVGASASSRIIFMFKLAAARDPDAREFAELIGAFNDHLAIYNKDREAALKLIHVGDSKPDPKLDPSELAAWTMMANLLLNLDEVINKG